MDVARHKEIMSYADTQFAPQWGVLSEQHNRDLREARYRARKTNNAAALLPAEAGCYVEHAKALVIAKARCIAEAYAAFSEPAGNHAQMELAGFFSTTVAVRRSCFKAEVELRQVRTRHLENITQLTFLLRGFEHDVHPALLEGRAIVDQQRVQALNRFRSRLATKYVVDTSVFNRITDGRIKKDILPSDGGFAITHIQVDEINKTKDEDRRAKLILTKYSLDCELLATESFLFDVSRLDHAKLSDGKLFLSIKNELDRLNKRKRNNSHDALIAETAISKGYVLLTSDKALKMAAEKHAGKVIFFP